MILALVEHDRGKLNEAVLEALSLGRRLAAQVGTTLEAVLVGGAARPLADGLGAYGVTTVHLAEHPNADAYAPAAWAQSIVALIQQQAPQAVVAAGTDRGQEVMAHVAARANLPLAANCVSVQPGDVYQVTRQRWGGTLLEHARLHGATKLLTSALHAFPAEAALSAEAVTVTTYAPALTDKDFRVRVTGRVEIAADKITLGEAKVVIGGGRGVGSAEGFQALEALAAVLGGAVGCSRAVTSLGWRPHADQIGQTGTRIAPEIYIACGVSGAVQHMVACKGAKHLLAINTDPEAPVIAQADYAVIGDLHQVLPAIVAEIAKQQAAR